MYVHILWLLTTLSRADYLIANFFVRRVFNVTLKCICWRGTDGTLSTGQMILLPKCQTIKKRRRENKEEVCNKCMVMKNGVFQFVLYLKGTEKVLCFFRGLTMNIERCNTIWFSSRGFAFAHKTETILFINDLYCVWVTKRMCTGVVC